MKVEVTINGQTVEVDVSLDAMTLRESVALEDHLGPEAYDRYAEGKITPKVMQGMLWAKLRSRFPDVTPDDFDVDFSTIDDEADAGPLGDD